MSIKNFRDVGRTINEILGYTLLKPSVLYRSGALTDLSNGDHLPPINSIINLRREEDPEFNKIKRLQIAPSATMNNYDITSDVFQEWIQRLYHTLAACTWPILIHCTAGKDRTGVAIALLLKNLELPDEIIVLEYMVSEGRCYQESMENLLQVMPKIGYLQMKESHKRTIKKKLVSHLS